METGVPSQAEQFGDTLVKQGLLSASDLARALRACDTPDAQLPTVIERLGLLKEDRLLDALSAFLNSPLLERAAFPSEPVLPDAFTPHFLKKHLLLPIEEGDDSVRIAFANPFDTRLKQSVEFHLERPISPALARARDIEWAINSLFETADTDFDDAPPSDDDIETLKNLATEQPVIKFVNRLIEDAIERRASDIHLESEDQGLAVRFRVDGILVPGEMPQRSMTAAIVSRIKIMARLNIAERRLPQDGRIRTTVRGQEIDLRVSTTPTLHGEGVVLRVLDKSAVNLEFSAIGFSEQNLARYTDLLSKPNGVILVTGPTGSGKTTTLYTSLAALNNGQRKIFSVEDPVEYQLAGVNQIQVQPQIGLDFARALRSILRQDPDIIMVGEIRDTETAEIAMQAALTGHLVLATLHTNSAAGTVTRILDMGVEDYLLASTVIGVVAQRLVRTLCTECSLPDTGALTVIEKIAPDLGAEFGTGEPRRAAGCPSCQGSGYKGRTSIMEIMPVADDIRRLVMNKATDREIESCARSQGMQTMLASGIKTVLEGRTTLDEVLRAVART